MPVASVNGLKKAASSAAVQLPPHVLTKIVRVWAIVRCVTMSGPADAAVAAANPLRNVRRRMMSSMAAPDLEQAGDAARSGTVTASAEHGNGDARLRSVPSLAAETKPSSR